MKRLTLLCTLTICLLIGQNGHGQDFSNKGKDFYLCFPNHVPSGSNLANMSLFITSDRNSSGTITVGALVINFSVTANQIAGPFNIPYATAHITTAETGIVVPKGIRVKVNAGQPPVVVYSHIYAAARSAASLILPVSVLGRKYYSCNFWQASTGGSRSQFQIIAVDSNTTIRYQLRRNGVLDPVGVVRTLPLPGDVLQIQDPQDLTGSIIESIAVGGEGCKKIAVFSGSSALSIGNRIGAGGSFDPLFQQLYPANTWGKEFGVIPFANNPNGYHLRVIAGENNTTVNVGGTTVVLNEGDHYPATNALPSPYTAAMTVSADKPITVATYMMSANRNGNPLGDQGDPDMIILNPVEQGIKDISVFSSSLQVINSRFLQVYIKTIAAPSFRINGNPPLSSFIPMAPANGYSYLVENITSAGTNSFRLTADSNFNATAYGLGDFETYAYSAGTNVKDLFQFVTVQNQHATVSFPTACKSSPFFLSMVFPYQPTSLTWQFNGIFPDVTINSPVADSSWVVSGRTVYRYKLPTPYVLNTVGTYPIRIIANNPSSDGCGNQQEIDFDLQVFENPTAQFAFTTDGCLTNPVLFRDSALNTQSRPIINYWWDFADAGATSTLQNPSHTFSAAGTYNVRHTVITDVGCISDTLGKLVTISDPPVAGFTVSAQKCIGTPITFTNSSTVPPGSILATWIWDFGDGNTVTVSNGNPQTHTYSATGNFNVTLRVITTSGCASQLFSFPLTVNVNPVAGFNFPGICLPVGAAQFTNTTTISDGTLPTVTYLWNFGDGNTSTLTNPLHNFTGTGPFTVTLRATSNNGCWDDSIRTVNTIFARPTAAFTVDSLESCIGGTTNFTDGSSAPGSNVTQWFWDFGDATTSTLQNPNHSYAAPGPYTVKLWINSGAGCRSDTMTRNITVYALPTVNFTNGSPVCQFGNLSLTSSSVPNGGSISQYSWTVNGNPTGGNNASIVYVPTTSGNHTINLTVLTDKGCSNLGTRTINVNPKPVAGFNFPNICLPVGAAQFTNTTTISDGTLPAVTYTWNFGDGNSSTLTNPLHNYTGTGPFTVILRATSNNGCFHDSARVINTIFQEPQAEFFVPSEVCLGTALPFTDQSVALNAIVNSWQWDFGDGNTSTVQHPTHTYTSAGTYTITLRIGTNVGCQTVGLIGSRTVTVNPLPTAAFNPSSPLCETRGVTFTDASAPNAGTLTTWRWNFGDGNTSVLTTAAPFTHTYPTAGPYTVTLQVETNKGCISTVLSRDIVVNNRPKAGFVAPEICLTDPFAPFLDTSSIAAGSITAWEWNFGDPNANAGNPNTSTLQNPTHRYTIVGNYTATLVAISAAGCRDTIAQTFTVNGSIPVAGVTINNPNILCSNKTVTVTDGSTVDFGNIIRTEIFWDYANDPTIKTVTNNPTPGATYSHTYPEFGSPVTKTVTVRYVVYSGINCVNTTTRTVTLLATPTVQFNTVNPVCDNVSSFNVTQASITNGLPGSGVFSGPGISSSGNFDPATAGAGQHIITYTYTGTNGCVNSATQTIRVNPSPNANAGPDKFVLEGGQVALTPAVFSGLPVTYTWTPPTYLDNPNIANAVVKNPADDITYTLRVTTDQGCFETDQVFVKVLKAPVIPNAFSPNGDGIHDRWEISFIESYPGAVIDVYNRYGQLVYHTVNYLTPWDGKINGRQAPVGTYYYIINPKNGRKPMTGYVDIIY
jgi:gliding motility-associated-like protein